MKEKILNLYKKTIQTEINTQELDVWSERDHESLELIKTLLPGPNSLVFDIGAHIGGKTDLFLSCQSRVVCVEPQPDCARFLKSKYMNRDDVWIEEVGLGASESFLEMKICSGAPTISTFSNDWVRKSRFTELGYQWDRTIRVSMTTLDKLIQKYGVPDFCKIDAENYEFEILRGLTRAIPCLSFEALEEYEDKTRLSLQYLASLGYREFNFTPGGRGLFCNAQWVGASTLADQLHEMIQTVDWSGTYKMYGDVYARL